MELLNENPDNNCTMRHLSELFLENATSPFQDTFVILVGDGKTYEHLTQINTSTKIPFSHLPTASEK
jgi:hypothetical protein